MVGGLKHAHISPTPAEPVLASPSRPRAQQRVSMDRQRECVHYDPSHMAWAPTASLHSNLNPFLTLQS